MNYSFNHLDSIHFPNSEGKKIRLVLNIVEYIKTKPHEQNFAIRVGTNLLKLVLIRYFVTSLSLIFQQPKFKVKHCEL